MYGTPLFDHGSSQGNNVVLSSEQEQVLYLVKKKENVFFTGPAGTGKSVLLRSIIKKLRPDHDIVNGVAITASTGIAALNIGGITLHSFAGIGLGKNPFEKLVEKIQSSIKVLQRWRTTRVLIIDEISMIDAVWFDTLEKIARKIRGNKKPFGGIQLIISGDFFQLPPVPERSHDYNRPSTFAFDAESWPKCITRRVFLSKVFRQKDDTFVTILSHMRLGMLTQGDIQHLNSLSRPLTYPDGIEPCELFPVRAAVDSCNKNKLRALPGPQYAYHAMDSAGYSVEGLPIKKNKAQELLNGKVVVPYGILLKIGAQVMLTRNIKEGALVNGSIGKIIEFMTITEAYDKGIKISDKSSPTEKNSPPSTDYVREDEMRPMTGHIFSRNEKWPVVQFENGSILLCAAIAFTVEGPLANVEARRVQIPLILAWAMTIHKSQGQTLERVKINLGNTFEKGQAYVAISRATSMDGLELHNFDPDRVKAHPKVVYQYQFWESSGNDDLPDNSEDDESVIRK